MVELIKPVFVGDDDVDGDDYVVVSPSTAHRHLGLIQMSSNIVVELRV